MKWGTGQVVQIERKRGAVWYARYREASGRQREKLIGPVWSAGGGRPPAGHYTRRMAQDWLRNVLLEDAQRHATGSSSLDAEVTFSEAAEEYLRYATEDRGCKPSTIGNYRSMLNAHLLPEFGVMRLEDITEHRIELWRARRTGARAKPLSNNSKNKQLVLLHGIMRRAVKVWRLPRNPVANVERLNIRRSGDIQVFSPEEVWSLVRAAISERDSAAFLTAAFTGLRRGEILALRWRDVDFENSTIRVRASYVHGQLTTPKSGKVRSVPMAPDVAAALARLGQRERFTGDDDFVFCVKSGLPVQGDNLTRSYETALAKAGLRRLRFHDLRHTFGTRMIGQADIRRVQEWMGHADIQTTMKYLHYQPRKGDADLVAKAFALESTGAAGDPAVSD